MQLARRLRKRCKIRGFRNRQFVHRFVEIDQRRGGDAVGAEAEIDFIEIEFEDAVLGIGALDAHRQQGFLDLAGEGDLVGQKEVLGDLLGDRRGALRALVGAEILRIRHGRARHAGEVDAAVLVEILVLGREERVGDEFWHRLDRQIEAPLLGILAEQRAVGRMDARHHRRLVILKLRIVGQIPGEMPDPPATPATPTRNTTVPAVNRKPKNRTTKRITEVPFQPLRRDSQRLFPVSTSDIPSPARIANPPGSNIFIAQCSKIRLEVVNASCGSVKSAGSRTHDIAARQAGTLADNLAGIPAGHPAVRVGHADDRVVVRRRCAGLESFEDSASARTYAHAALRVDADQLNAGRDAERHCRLVGKRRFRKSRTIGAATWPPVWPRPSGFGVS